MAASHSAPQLVQLRQAELVGAVHDHGVRVRDVETRLDDHRRHEDVHFGTDEARHDVVQLGLLEPAMRHRDAGARRRECAHALGDGVDRLDTVVHEIHLPRPVELPRQRLLDERVVPRLDERQHGGTVFGRRLEQRQVAQSGEREVQRAGDRRRRERQHIHRELQRLQSLLVPHPEPVLLVHDEQAQVVKPDVARQQPVRADHQVHLPPLQALDDAPRVARAAKTRQHFDAHGIVGQPLAEGASVLLGEDRGGREHRHLLPHLHRFKGRPQRDLGLAVSDVADQ